MKAHVCALLIVAALLVGCAALAPRLESPNVTIADLDLASAGLFEQRFNLTLRIQNPNDEDLHVDGISFDVEVNDESFAHGVGNTAITVPRYGTALLPIEAVSSLGGLIAQIGALSRSGKPGFAYRLKGTVALAGRRNIHFDRRGEFSFMGAGK